MTRTTKFALAYFAAYVIGFLLLRTYIAADALIVLLNGFFVGSIFSAFVAFFPLMRGAFLGRLKYQDAGQFSLGLFMLLLGITFGVAASIWVRGTGGIVTSLTLTALARYTVSHGLLLLVYAPDFGLGLLAGRDRKITAVALAVGFIAAVATIYVQAVELLA